MGKEKDYNGITVVDCPEWDNTKTHNKTRKETRYYKDTDGKIKSRVIIHEDIYFKRNSSPMKEDIFTYPNIKATVVREKEDDPIFINTKELIQKGLIKVK